MVIRYKWTIIGSLLGAVGGFSYWYFIGCTTGSCPITTSPYLSSGYGLLMGFILTWPNNKKKEKKITTMDLQSLIKSQTATLVDVRTPGEFHTDHAKKTINIPLNEIPSRIDEFKSMQRPIILCCASGGRSGQATDFLTRNGVDDVYNAGSFVFVKNCLL